ncbi:MAG TPA: hypothetical protein VFK05_36675 [Polyangiaceae bacterium]|nr:hypothetical protein [Polyangiaceae bacterium]
MVSNRSLRDELGRVIASVSLALALAGCGAADAQHGAPGPGEFGAACGFDKPECAAGLECFGVCTVNCESPEGIAECTAREGTCEQYAPSVQINFCKLPAGVTARP